MMLSLRDVARRCLGVTGSMSVNRDVFGYIFRDIDGSLFGQLQAGDILPGSGTATNRSLQRHLQTINGSAFDLVPIFVGHQNDFSGTFTPDQATRVQYAIQIARDIYAQRNVGIRRIKWQFIADTRMTPSAYANIRNRAEAQNLTDDFSGPLGGIDVFFVQSIGDADGWSNVDGPCDKDSSDDLTGAVLEVSGSRRITGILLGHEVGHYLGLGTGTSATNVMGVDINPPDGIDEIGVNSTGLTAEQGTTMRSHCSVDVSPSA
ncbi:hypothetical protein ACWF9G_08905 [Nocardia sp. NPDC055029]